MSSWIGIDAIYWQSSWRYDGTLFAHNSLTFCEMFAVSTRLLMRSMMMMPETVWQRMHCPSNEAAQAMNNARNIFGTTFL